MWPIDSNYTRDRVILILYIMPGITSPTQQTTTFSVIDRDIEALSTIRTDIEKMLASVKKAVDQGSMLDFGSSQKLQEASRCLKATDAVVETNLAKLEKLKEKVGT